MSHAPSDLLQLRFQAAARESSRLHTLVNALNLAADSTYSELVTQHGWSSHEALAITLLQLQQANERITRMAFPD